MSEHRKGLALHSLILLAAAQFSNVGGLLFHMLLGGDWVSWSLPAEEYQILVFMLNSILIAVLPMDAVRTTIGHYVSLMSREDREGDIRRFFGFWTMRMLGAGAVLILLAWLFSASLMDVFHIEQRGIFLLAMATLALTLMLPLCAGVFQGMQRFVFFSLAFNLVAVLRLIFAIFLVIFFAPKAVSGVLAQFFSTLICVFLGFVGVYLFTRRAEPSEQALPKISGYLLQSVLVLLGYGILFNGDIHLAQYFLPDSADMAARAGTIARAVVFLPMPIALALFPKVSSHGDLHREDLLVLGRALLYVSILLAGIAGLCSIRPDWPLLGLYGIREPSEELLRTVRTYVLSMTPLALSYLFLNFHMAQRRFAPCWLILAAAPIYILGVRFYHPSVEGIARVLGCVTLTTCILLVLHLIWTARGLRRQALR